MDYRYESRCELKGRWDRDAWVVELRIPLKELAHAAYAGKDPRGQPWVNLPIPDGAVWWHYTARALDCAGSVAKFFSSFPGGWCGLPTRLVFDSRGVAAQATSSGQLMRDQVDFDLALKNHGEKSQTVRVDFFVENDKELIVDNGDEEFVDLLPGEVKRLRITRDRVGVTPQGNAVWLDVRTLDGSLVQQSLMTPFHHMKGFPDFEEAFMDGMKMYRDPRRPFEYRFAYYPSTNAVAAWVDTDVFGVEAAAKTAVEAKVTLLTERGDVVQSLTIPLEALPPDPARKTYGGRSGYGVMRFPSLPEGRYKTACLLYDANKRIVGDQSSILFEQKHYPWERSTEGLEDVCWEGYVPLVWDGGARTVQTLMHTFTLAGTALPEQITIQGKNPAYGPQLTAPIRLEASARGSRHVLQPTGAAKPVKDGRSEMVFEGAGTAGPVAARTRVQYECDGFILADVWYRSGAEPIETLEWVADLGGPLDLFSFGAREGGFVPGIFTNRGPVVWTSLDGLQPRPLFYGNFTPVVFLGNGDRAFTWACETDGGMKLLADRPAAQVERRTDGGFTLRVFWVNEPGPVPEERHVRFGWITQPTRPKAKDHRAVCWGLPPQRVFGLTPGDGANYAHHLNHEEDYALYRARAEKEGDGNYYGCYLSACHVTWDLPGLKELTYAGEWTGRTDIYPRGGAWSLMVSGGTGGSPRSNPVTGRPFDTLYKLSCLDLGGERINWSASWADSLVYWLSRQVRLAGVQGWWWDYDGFGTEDHDPVVGNAYWLPPHKQHAGGRLQNAWVLFLPREVHKRVQRVAVQNHVPNRSSIRGGFSTTLCESFFRWELNWEGNAGYSGELPHMQQYPPAFTRFCTAPFSGLSGRIIDNVNWYRDAGGDPAGDRSNLANALLHDVGSDVSRLANPVYHSNVVSALQAFGFFDDPDVVEYVPYWRSRHLYRYGIAPAETDGSFANEEEKQRASIADCVLASIYRNHKTGKALFVLANASAQPIMENLYVPDSLLGRSPTKCTDVEIHQPIRLAPDFKSGAYDAGSRQAAKRLANMFCEIFILPWQFRLLVVE
jgi:hypothetical protein